ncbi:MAG: hypothetical protein RJA07_403 [Bacteroidota bacterium]|jgi:hypothetical protein
MNKPFYKLLFLIAFTFSIQNLNAQNVTQTIRGSITDKQSKLSLAGATIQVMNTNPTLGDASTADGKFKIINVPVGRYDIKVNYIGYKEVIISNIELTAGKEVVMEIELEENVKSLKQINISASKKHETNNELTTVSARSFSTEEVNRYAGARSDPARMAANFAGVSSPDDSRNDLVIRGNSPIGVLWRIEGMNVPNPNHFATVTSNGGPVSAINTNMLKNSDFFTSAFPAEYGNANAGVFDLGFRKGNAEKREHTFQIGALTGIEAMTEGPINKAKGSSYLLSYRYAFTGVAQKIGIPIGTTATPFYQDLSFKIVGGESKMGRFTLFGIGAKSHIFFDHNKIDSADIFANPSVDSHFNSDIGLVGVKHFIRVNDKSYLNTVIGATYTASKYLEDTVFQSSTYRSVENTTKQYRYNVNTSFNTKINSHLFLKVGVIDEIINLNLFYQVRKTNTGIWKNYWNYNDYMQLLQGYVQAKYNFTDKITLNVGVHSQYLTLNNSNSIEPRLGLKYQISNKSTLSAGVGLHSQMQTPDIYFYREQNADGTYNESNKKLDFTHSRHFVLGYDYLPAKDWRIKSEIYYQALSNVPVTITPSSFSLLNSGASFNPINKTNLVNNGTGTNYGFELTIEKFFSKGYYALLTGSVYQSKYKGSDNIEHNTAFNGEYVYNILAGKEFKVGKEKRNRITFDYKLTQAGGRYYTPTDSAASILLRKEILKGDSYAFSKKIPDFFRMDFKIGFTYNGKQHKISQSFFFDMQNITGNKNVFAYRYNSVTNKVNTSYQIGFFPNFVYRMQF